MDIRFEDTGSGGRYSVAGEGGEAELTFSRAGAQWIADHTVVPEGMRGQGVGEAMALRLVEDARAADARIVALCPFVKAQARRHPEWSDVVM